MKQAYCTLLSSQDYLKAVLILNRSLKAVGSKYPLIAMIPKSVINVLIRDICQRENILIEIVPDIQYNDNVRERYANHSVLNTASKLRIFSLKHWDKLVYLDADMVAIRNCDDIFNYLDGAIYFNIENRGGFSALFVIEPKNHSEGKYLEFLLQNYNIFDGDYFFDFWFQCKSNPDYRIPIHYIKNYEDKDFRTGYLIHYCNQLYPWKKDLDDKFFDSEVGMIYYKYLLQLSLAYYI